MSVEFNFGKRSPVTEFGDGRHVLTFDFELKRNNVVSGDEDTLILETKDRLIVRPKKHRRYSTERREVTEKIFVRGDAHNAEGDVGGFVTREKTLRTQLRTVTEHAKTRRPDWLNVESTVTTRQETHLHKGRRMTIRGIHLRGI